MAEMEQVKGGAMVEKGKCLTEGCEVRRHAADCTGYCKECKKKGSKAIKKSPGKSKPKTPPAMDMVVELKLELSETRLDQMWSRLDLSTKGTAIQYILGLED